MIKLDNAAHYYLSDGTPFHEVPCKSRPGEMRPTTIADARKAGASPSVTTIMRVLNKESLNVWKQNQVLMSALTHPKRNELPAEEFAAIVAQESAFEAEKARERGTKVHAAIEMLLQGNVNAATDLWKDIPHFTLWWQNNGCATATTESLLVPAECGFGGRIDCVSGRRIYDFKTTELKKKDEVAFYPEHVEQLAAYRHGLGPDYAKHDLVSVVIPVDAPDKIAMKIWSEEEAAGGLEVFQAAYRIWKIRNKWK
jgi:hypothetical protein